MKIQLTNKESEEYFYNSLCNALGYVESGYGISLQYDTNAYEIAMKSLTEKDSQIGAICYEDVLMEILRLGGELTMEDQESGVDDHKITLKDVHERVQNTPVEHIMNMVNENDDAETGDVIIQQVFYNEIIFG